MARILCILLLCILSLASCDPDGGLDESPDEWQNNNLAFTEGLVSDAMRFVGTNPKAYVVNHFARLEDGQVLNIIVQNSNGTQEEVDAIVETSIVEYDDLSESMKSYIASDTETDRDCMFQNGHDGLTSILDPDKYYVEFATFRNLKTFEPVRYQLAICKGSDYSKTKSYAKGYTFSTDFSYEYLSNSKTNISFTPSSTGKTAAFAERTIFYLQGEQDAIAFSLSIKSGSGCMLSAWYTNSLLSGSNMTSIASGEQEVVVIMPYVDYGKDYGSRYRYEFQLAVHGEVVDTFIVDMARHPDKDSMVEIQSQTIPEEIHLLDCRPGIS